MYILITTRFKNHVIRHRMTNGRINGRKIWLTSYDTSDMALQTDNESEQRCSSHFSLDSNRSPADKPTRQIDRWSYIYRRNARVNVAQSRRKPLCVLDPCTASYHVINICERCLTLPRSILATSNYPTRSDAYPYRPITINISDVGRSEER